MRRATKLGIFLAAYLWGQSVSHRLVLYESALERYFQIPAWSEASSLKKPDTIRFLRIKDTLPTPFPTLPNLQALYVQDIEELDLEAFLRILPQKCPKLTVLALEDCDIGDLTPFRAFGMPLRGLLLDMNDFEDLTPLSHLRSLEVLSLGQTPVRSLSPLASLSNLKGLDIQETRVSDISILRQLKGLRIFSAYKAVSITDLSPLLLHQGTLEVLNISFLPTALTAPLWKNLPAFQALKVFQAQEAIPDQSALAQISQLRALEELTVGRNPVITDLRFVETLVNLMYLDIHSCAVQDLSPLSRHPNLIKLIIARNPIPTLAPLRTCPRLVDLYCYEVPARDWETLLEIPNLTHVMLKKSDLPADKQEAILSQLRRRGVRVDAV